MAEGRMGNPSRGRQRFRTYVEQEWLPNHQMEARTRENLQLLPRTATSCRGSARCG